MSAQPKDLLKRLQHMQRLIERACAERDLAHAEAAQWKRRYEAEAHQRRIERSQLEAVMQRLNSTPQGVSNPDAAPVQDIGSQGSVAQSEIAGHSNDKWTTSLIREREQLRLALEQEKENHQKTRASLITALGDALQRKSC